MNINNLTITTRKGRKLIENLTLTINENDKIAIIGEEGNGKSTLLKAIYDKKLIEDFCDVEGEINLKGAKAGYLEQVFEKKWDDSYVYEYF